MSVEKIKQFNQILDSFLIQIKPLIGTSYHYKFTNIIKINSTLPIKQFIAYAIPIRDKIINRDESYFNDNTNHEEKAGDNLNAIIKLQGIYSQIDSESKSNIWEFLQALLIISEEYIAMTKKI
jgi:hypothetical protein